MPTLQEAVQGHVNGHQKGRDVPPEKLYDFTFEGTGRAVQVRKLSTLIRDEVRRAVRRDPQFPKEPEPPLVEVDYGAGKIIQPHRGHPVYQELLKEWQAKFSDEVSERLITLVIHRGVVCEVDEQAVAQVRSDMAAAKSPLDDYCDHYVYVAFVCVGPYNDYQALLKAIFERTMPSDEAVQAHKDSFRGDVRGQVDLASESGPDRDGEAGPV